MTKRILTETQLDDPDSGFVDLEVAFDRWRYQHADEWSDADRLLAIALSAFLGVGLEWDD